MLPLFTCCSGSAFPRPPPRPAISHFHPFCSPRGTECQGSPKAHWLECWGQAFRICIIKIIKLHLREVLCPDPVPHAHSRTENGQCAKTKEKPKNAIEILGILIQLALPRKGALTYVWELCVCACILPWVGLFFLSHKCSQQLFTTIGRNLCREDNCHPDPSLALSGDRE